ncbi:MAG: YicC family protein [Planctomycetes bacterium]|nr:YicC family protein [Planctomycetota bacterium]
MTGVGFATGQSEVGDLRIEVRSVNGRGFTVKLRLPPAFGCYEAGVDELVRSKVARGSLTVVVERVQSAPALPDAELVRATASAMLRLADELRLPPPTLAEVLQWLGSAGRSDASTSRPLPPQFRALLERAVDDLLRHRGDDGNGTVAAILAELDRFAVLAKDVAARAPALAEDYRGRLLLKVQEFVQRHVPSAPPATDLVKEVAVFADRIDVAEELQRQQAHLAEVRAVLARGGEVGKRLEFLLQELLRETNTLGSKSPDTSIAHAVVAMKTCIERMKEQAANLE